MNIKNATSATGGIEGINQRIYGLYCALTEGVKTQISNKFIYVCKTSLWCISYTYLSLCMFATYNL